MRKIYLSFITVIFVVLLTLTGVLVGVTDLTSGRSVYLNPTNIDRLAATKNKEKPVHTFFADEADNLALYRPNKRNNDINDARFFGNLDAYNGLVNQDIILTTWKNDNVNSQIVVKNNMVGFTEIDPLTVQLVNEEFLENQGIKVRYGFSDFVYASRNFNNPQKMLNPWGVHETLLVPEKITENKVLSNVNPNKVNILFIRIKTSKTVTASTIPFELRFNFLYQNQVVNHNSIKLRVKNYTLPDQDDSTSVFIFSNFSRAANYWSNGVIPKAVKQNLDAQNRPDPREFIQAIWPYVKSDYAYNAQVLKSPYFISNIVPGRDPSNLDKYYWTTESIHISLMEWNRTVDGKIYASDRSWEAMKWYINQMYDLGMRDFFMQGIQTVRRLNAKTFYLFDEASQKFVQAEIGAGTAGNENLAQILDELWNHRQLWQTERPELKEMNYYLYTDEQLTDLNGDISRWLKTYQHRQDYKFAITMVDKDIDYNHVEQLYDVDLMWVFLQDIYNENYPKFMNLVHQRKARWHETGQYSLDGDNTFNLTRADPGINAYVMLAQQKEGAGHYLKYSSNAWNPDYILWSSDYDERKEYVSAGANDIQYLSGDTIFSYAYKAADENFELRNQDDTTPFLPATRLESLNQGKNLVKKINYLHKMKIINDQELTYLYKNIDIRNKESWIMSNQKFNFNYDVTSIVDEIHRFQPTSSLVARFARKQKVNFDEVTAYKTIRNFVNTK